MRLRPVILALAANSLLAQIAIEHVTIIDPRSNAVLTDHSVLIRGTEIERVAPSSKIQPGPNYRRVDGTDRYLIPGLWDSHVHLTKAGDDSLALFLANGVTSVRDMGSDTAEVLQWRREILAGQRPGPRIWTSGRILESKANYDRQVSDGGVEPVERIRIGVGTPEEASQAVRRLAAGGVHHIKIRTVTSPGVFNALVSAARRAKLALVGHPIGKPEEFVGRMKSVEHLIAYPPMDDLTREQRSALFRQMRGKGTWISTTAVNLEGSILIPYERAAGLLADTGRLDFRRRYVGGYLLADWREQVEEKQLPDFDAIRKAVPGALRDLAEAKEAGVKFLAGTDVGVVFMYAGFSLHDELRLYVSQLGFSPMEALRAATHNPAEFYGIESRQGGIAPGQAADLVLLDANPLENVANTRMIQSVVSAGRVWTRRLLDALLAETAKRVEELQEPGPRVSRPQ